MFKQEIKLIGKVFYATTEVPERNKSGKLHQKYSFGIRLSNGAGLFISSMVYNIDNMKDFSKEKRKEYDNIIELFENKQDVYIMTTAYPSKDGSMFNTLSTYEDSEGEVKISMRAGVSLLEHKEDDDEQVLIREKGDIGYKKFNQVKQSIRLTMAVEDTYEEHLELTCGAEAYPIKIVGKLPEGVGNRAQVGQGYVFDAEIKKGGTAHDSHNAKVLKSYSWDEEAKDTQVFSPDYIELRPTGIRSEYKIEIDETESMYFTKNNNTEFDAESFPF